MKRTLFYSTLIYLLTATAVFSGEADIFLKANNAYAKGAFEEALGYYTQLADKDIQSGYLFYNIGNTYFKLGRIGKALANYERARLRLGYDQDLAENIAYLKSFLKQAQPLEVKSLPERVFDRLINFLTTSGWFIAAAACYFGVIFLTLCGVLFSSWRTRLKPFFIIACVCFLATAGAFIFREQSAKKVRRSIVTAKETSVRYSPSFSGGVAFTISEGIFIDLLRLDGPWALVRLTKGKSGWVPSQDVEII